MSRSEELSVDLKCVAMCRDHTDYARDFENALAELAELTSLAIIVPLIEFSKTMRHMTK